MGYGALVLLALHVLSVVTRTHKYSVENVFRRTYSGMDLGKALRSLFSSLLDSVVVGLVELLVAVVHYIINPQEWLAGLRCLFVVFPYYLCSDGVVWILVFPFTLTFVLARAYLVVECFVSLFHSPPGIFIQPV